ncbi:TPA: hypothetical protein ACSK9D_002932, partial [Listeria innocua]
VGEYFLQNNHHKRTIKPAKIVHETFIISWKNKYNFNIGKKYYLTEYYFGHKYQSNNFEQI